MKDHHNAQYFNKFPKIYYDAAGHNYKLVTNLLRRVQIKSGLKESGALFDMYDVGGEETPESYQSNSMVIKSITGSSYYLTMSKIVSMINHYQVNNLKHTSMTSMLM